MQYFGRLRQEAGDCGVALLRHRVLVSCQPKGLSQSGNSPAGGRKETTERRKKGTAEAHRRRGTGRKGREVARRGERKEASRGKRAEEEQEIL